MKVSLNWLKEFVEIPVGVEQLRLNLRGIGLGVESLQAYGDDWVLDLEVTTNRPDCLSHYGVARELAALYSKPLKPLNVNLLEAASPTADEISIRIDAPDLCARYCGRVVQNLQVKPSPDWLARRLETVGMRPINNVADATNYVLMELGQPLHAFDLARLENRQIIVRRAQSGEVLRTLDGFNRTLTAENLVIADNRRPVALAGVMGGEESEITVATKAVLLESAWFDPVSIRLTAKTHGLHTEASHRFERGADVAMAPVALDRVAELIATLAGGEVLRGMVDVYPTPRAREHIWFRQSEIVRVLGADVPGEEIERYLRALGFGLERKSAGCWQVTPPAFRLDVTREVDLVEEVARHYGYDRLPARVRAAPPRIERDVNRDKLLTISATLVGLGYFEIIPSSMVDPEENAKFSPQPPVVLANPLSQDASALRATTVPSMVRALKWNLDRDQTNLRLFEIGKTYSPDPAGLAQEPLVLTLGLSGNRGLTNVHEGEKPIGFFDLKGDVETILGLFDLGPLRFEAGGESYYDPHQVGRFCLGNQSLVVCGQLNRDLAAEYKLRQPVWLAELDLQRLLRDYPLRPLRFRAYSKFPAVVRDFSLTVPENVTYQQIEQALNNLSLPNVRNFVPIDLFCGNSVGQGLYSLLLRVTFQSHTHTLTGEEISEASQSILAALDKLGISLRSSGI